MYPPAIGGNGAGIYNAGSATLINVTISGNWEDSNYGGIRGGGIFNDDGAKLTLTNCTLSANHSNSDGGGLFNAGSATLVNVTIGTNGGDDIYNSGTTTLTNTIVANSFGSGQNCRGTVASLGHNLGSDTSCGLTGPGDISNTDPKLGPLQDNGGRTLTQALLPGSAAIDAGSPDCPPPTTDQRGSRRPQGAACDIGAYEFAPLGCAGDCDQNSEVSVDELVRGVNIILGILPLDQCPSFDSSGDHRVTVDELVVAVNNALNGCG